MGPELFVSENAKAMVLDLLKNAEKRNPDAFDMYVYNGEQHVERLYYSLADRRTLTHHHNRLSRVRDTRPH